MQAGDVCSSLGTVLVSVMLETDGLLSDLAWLVFVMLIIASVAFKDAGFCYLPIKPGNYGRT